MYKNMTRKGLAFGAGLALIASGLAATPAQAATETGITLEPSAGKTYNSILQSGFELVTANDAAAEPFLDADVVFFIDNPDAHELVIQVRATAGGSGESEAIVTSDVARTSGGGTYGGAAATHTTSAKFIAIDADTNDFLHIGTTVTDETVTVEVQAVADVDNDAFIDTFERVSPKREVNLYPVGSVPVTTKMSSTTNRNADELVATVQFGLNVNPFMVQGDMGVAYFKDGTNVTLTASAESDATTGAVKYFATTNSSISSTGILTSTAEATGASFVTTSKLNAGIYTARAIYVTTTPDVFMGARSAALDLRDGTNGDVTGAKVVFTETANVDVDSGANNAVLRAKTLSVGVVGQILKGSAELDDAGVRVRATVTGSVIGSGTEITVQGSSDVIDAASDTITVFGFTDSDGRFPIVINSNKGANADKVTVVFEALLDTGLYAAGAGATEEILWANASLQTTLKATPSSFLTGETVNVTLTAVDQFGVGMDSTSNGRLSIRVEAYIGGAADSDEYTATVQTSNGAASFSFDNFASAGSDQQIEVRVFAGSTTEFTSYFTVYNNVATSGITVADDFSTRVQYVDYVTGKTSDAAILKAATDAGVIAEFNGSAGTDFATISGTVLDANNAGQPGVAVNVSADGVLFHDADTNTLAEDSITLIANAQGFFDVQALTQKAVPAGATVTITAGGVTETTLLKSYLATDIDSKNLVLEWNLPANVVKDTTYSIAVSLKDVFGNPVRTTKLVGSENVNALTLEADGSLQVNGVATISRNFNTTGVATVFIRSVNDVAGPGQLRAILTDLDYFTGGPSAETGNVDNATATHLDVKSTSWNEAAWASSLSSDIDVLATAPVSAAATGKVNVGSFNGKLVVYAAGLDGAKISWKVAGRWGVANASGNLLNRFDRPVGASGVNVNVEIYVNGVKQLTKTVLTR